MRHVLREPRPGTGERCTPVPDTTRAVGGILRGRLHGNSADWASTARCPARRSGVAIHDVARPHVPIVALTGGDPEPLPLPPPHPATPRHADQQANPYIKRRRATFPSAPQNELTTRMR